MRHNKKISAASVALCLSATVGTASAVITIHGSTTAYQESNANWLTAGTNDIDGSGGLGTDGFFFAGDGSADTNQETSQAFTANVTTLPTYVSSIVAGANFASIADDVGGYGSYDDPIALDGTDALGGLAVAAGGGAGDSREVFVFTVLGLAPNQTVRVGVLSNVDNNTNGRWDATSITLSDGTSSATVGSHGGTQLANGAGQTDWVFFDLDADGTYAVSGTKRLARQGVGLSGLTFDSVAIPEPSSSVLMGLGALVLCGTRRRKA